MILKRKNETSQEQNEGGLRMELSGQKHEGPMRTMGALMRMRL